MHVQCMCSLNSLLELAGAYIIIICGDIYDVTDSQHLFMCVDLIVMTRKRKAMGGWQHPESSSAIIHGVDIQIYLPK